MPLSLIDQKKNILDQARAVAERAKSAGRNLTSDELTAVNSAIAEAKRLGERIEAEERGAALYKQLGAIDPSGRHPGGDGNDPRYLDLSPAGRKAMATTVAEAMVGFADGRRSILPAGEQYVSVPTLPDVPVVLGKQTQTLLGLLPVTKIAAGAKARYLRQATRTNLAAAVAPGSIKPTSVYGITPQDVELSVYAHLSEPQDRFAMEDSANVLAQFIANELLYGLFEAVERDVIGGTGTPVGITGILATSGIRLETFAVDVLTTTRNAVATSEALGYADSLTFVLSPADWAAAQLLQAQTGGGFLMPGAPNEMPSASLWGVPVAVSTGLPVKTGLLLNTSGLALYTDQQGIRTDWGAPNDSWSRNEIVARNEGRFALGVLQPAGQVKIETATTP